MDSGKVDDLLNLAIQTPEDIRSNTSSLDVGYLPKTKSWEIIVKYTGSLADIASAYGVQAEELLSGYGILIAEEYKIDALAASESIAYMEKPYPLIFSSAVGRESSCLTPLRSRPYELSGNGVIVAIIDSGIDYSHPDFRNEDGSSRILYYWDQTVAGSPPSGYLHGTLYTKEQIDEVLKINNPGKRMTLLPSIDPSGHGTHVAGIACGNGRASNKQYMGVAPQSDMIVVKAGTSINDSSSKSNQIMEAIDFCIRTAIQLHKPIAINLSYGNNYGSHDGRSLFEQYINDVSLYSKSSIVIGTGNEGSSGRHTHGVITQNQDTNVEIAVPSNELAFSLQFWKNYYDTISIEIISPSNKKSGFLTPTLGKQDFYLDQTEVLLYYAPPNPINKAQEIYIEFVPRYESIAVGIWKIHLHGDSIVTGEYDMWLPSGSKLISGTRFTSPTAQTTLTVPSTAYHAITVGAYDAYQNRFAEFSGQGYTRYEQLIKPDICAPGVNIIACDVNGGYSIKSGTSMATPFVTGTAALLMEWGIILKNDPYLYGEKLKSYLIKGAKHLPAFKQYPNPQIGWGVLCAKNSFPDL